VSVDGVVREFFEIHSGVRQGCVLSPLLVGIVMDWILKTSMKDRAEIEQLDAEKLSDLDFADDMLSLKTHGKKCKPRHQHRKRGRQRSLNWSLTWQRPRS